MPEALGAVAVVALAALPLSANGKVDRRALPDPFDRSTRRPVVRPDGPAEEQVAAAWRVVLAVDEVGADDDFFDLGGHSLLMAVLAGELERRFAGAPPWSRSCGNARSGPRPACSPATAPRPRR